MMRINVVAPVNDMLGTMSSLTPDQQHRLAERMRERKASLLAEIRTALAPTARSQFVDLLGQGGDAADESVASLLRDITESEVVRDVGEVRDIVAAEQRLAAGRFGICIDCGEAIEYKRLEAYPTAKRCLACQQHREKTRAASKYTGR
ncbi:MAG TPA: TraR/DksA family transcriptional regulator [Burkholderiaceae bacterium]|nr:TraR/DksA family transcriptional regulator [Burkholderiaceae bacterium]